MVPFWHISQITSSILHIRFSNFGSKIFKILIIYYNFLFYYRAYWRSYRTLSLHKSGALNRHQPHHGLIFIRSASTSTSPPPLPPLPLPSTPLRSPDHPVVSPSPLLRDVGSTSIATAPSQARMQSQQPLPFLKGCGRHSLA